MLVSQSSVLGTSSPFPPFSSFWELSSPLLLHSHYLYPNNSQIYIYISGSALLRSLNPCIWQPAQCHLKFSKHLKINMLRALLMRCPLTPFISMNDAMTHLSIQARNLGFPGHPCPYSPHPIIIKSLRETMSSQRQGSCHLPLCSSPQRSVLTYGKCLRSVCGINEWVDPLIDQETDHSSWEESPTFWTQTQAQSCWIDYNLHSWKFVSVISCCVTNYPQSIRT